MNFFMQAFVLTCLAIRQYGQFTLPEDTGFQFPKNLQKRPSPGCQTPDFLSLSKHFRTWFEFTTTDGYLSFVNMVR